MVGRMFYFEAMSCFCITQYFKDFFKDKIRKKEDLQISDHDYSLFL